MNYDDSMRKLLRVSDEREPTDRSNLQRVNLLVDFHDTLSNALNLVSTISRIENYMFRNIFRNLLR